MSLDGLTEDELTRVLAYAGLVLVAFELVKSLIVNPIKVFYRNVTFGEGMHLSPTNMMSCRATGTSLKHAFSICATS